MSNFFIILSLVALLVGLAAHGLMSPDQAAGALVVLAILLAIGRAMGTGLAGTVLRVGIPILSIIALALYYGGGSREAAVNIVAQLCTLGLVVFGIYLMVFGPFRR
jgi:4-amino-4-deoxy-L-arabinose transferase-like glycosyltransferase